MNIAAAAASKLRVRLSAVPSTTRVSILVALLLAVIAGVASFMRAPAIDPIVYRYWGYGSDATTGPTTESLLFDSDVPQVYEIMTDRFSFFHQRSYRHPLMSPPLFLPTKAATFLGLSEPDAVRLVVALIAAAWTGLVFGLFRLWGLRNLDAAIFTTLAGVSGAAVMWFSVPEIFGPGSLTILAAIILASWPRRAPAIARHAAGIILSFSMTATNVVMSLIVGLRTLSLKALWIAGASAWLIISLLWELQSRVFEKSTFFLPFQSDFAVRHSVDLTPVRALEVVQSYIFHTIVLPAVELTKAPAQWTASVQNSEIGSSGVVGLLASLTWALLLALGLYGWRRAPRDILVALAGMSLFQLMMHSVFGKETFLYSLHFLPLLVGLAAAVTFTPMRRIGLGLAVLTIGLCLINNITQFEIISEITREADAWARAYTAS